MEALQDLLYNGENAWILRVFLVVLTTGLLHLLLRLVLHRIERHFAATSNWWDDALIHAAQRPLSLLVWVIGLRIAAEVVEGVTNYELFQYAGLAQRIAIILLLLLFLLRFIKLVEDYMMKRKEKAQVETDVVTIRVIARLVRLSVIITAVLVILQTLNIPITGVAAFGGIGGLAVGFAAKDLLANFFGGLMIYLDRPFTVGDWVRSPDRNIEGTVEDIGWRLSVIRTFDKRPLYIPNSTFATIAVENPSRMTNRRIYETIGLRYQDSARMGPVVADVKKMLLAHPEIDTNQMVMANFNGMAASSLEFFIYCFTKTTQWAYFHEVKQDVLLKIIDIIHAHGADIAFPTRTLDGLEVLLNHDGEAAAPPAEKE